MQGISIERTDTLFFTIITFIITFIIMFVGNDRMTGNINNVKARRRRVLRHERRP